MTPRAELSGGDFGSDNRSGVHPRILEAIAAANDGHAEAYGADAWTERLGESFRRCFGPGARAYPVFNGTGANVLCLELLGEAGGAVICSSDAHINVDECGAPERITGMKLLAVETEHGKLEPADVGRWDARRGDEHHVQPRVVSISQSTELGTVYTPDQVRALADAAHERDMYLHMDGARLANAAAALELPPAALTTDVGVDALSFGGTKNGLLLGEVTVLLGEVDDSRVPFARKQLMQLASKMRFVSAQFEALLAPGEGEGEPPLWLANAGHANAMAARLAERVGALDGAELVQPVEANALFVRLSRAAIDELIGALPEEHPFYIWDEGENVVRWVCSWDTAAADIERLCTAVEGALG